mgnify:CR=1 FL=1
MNKAMFMTGAAGYALGFLSYVIIYVGQNWGETDYLIYKTGEGISRGLMWPYLVAEWFLNGTPLM